MRYGLAVRPMLVEVGLGVAGCAAVIAGVALIANRYDSPITGKPTGVAYPVVILIVVTLLMTYLAKRRRFGRYVYAYGGNPEAAELSGINTRRTVMLTYTLMGVLVAVSAAIQTARLNAAVTNLGVQNELDVIAAAVIGGTSFSGGIGTIAGAVLGRDRDAVASLRHGALAHRLAVTGHRRRRRARRRGRHRRGHPGRAPQDGRGRTRRRPRRGGPRHPDGPTLSEGQRMTDTQRATFPSEPGATPLVEMRNICVAFGGLQAVNGVSVDLYPGEVVALVGGNGAGKSTLMHVLSGAHPADSGEMLISGEPVTIHQPRDAQKHGIETIYQKLALAENIDAAGNVFLGRELRTRFGALDDSAMAAATQKVVERLNPRFKNLKTPVNSLSGGQRQTVAIARAIYFDTKILIMDEPTAALGPHETNQVRDLVTQLKAEGIGIFLISHDIHDVFDLADRISVMLMGRLVGTVNKHEVTKDEVLAMIIMGRRPGEVSREDIDELRN